MWEGPLPILPPGGYFFMKRGKKYQDAVKAFDKSAQYDVAEAISLVKKNLKTILKAMDADFTRTDQTSISI